MSTAGPASLVELRRLSVRLEPRRVAVVSTGHEALDGLLLGGLPRGRLTELVGPRSSGRTAVAVSALSAATRRGEAAALIDVDGVFDPRRAEGGGVDLGRLLWVHTGDGQRALRAADLVLAAGGFRLLVIDFGEWPPRGREAAFLRLLRAAERAQAACLVVAPQQMASSFAALTLEASSLRPILSCREGAPRLLRAIECQLCLVRTKLGAPGGHVRLRLAWR